MAFLHPGYDRIWRIGVVRIAQPLTVSYKRNALPVNPFADVIYLIYRPMCYLSQGPCLFHDSQAVMVRLISALLEGQPH